MDVINAVAQFERDLLIERTQAGLAVAKSKGKTLGRPKLLSKQEQDQVMQLLGEGKTIVSIARMYKTSRQNHAY